MITAVKYVYFAAQWRVLLIKLSLYRTVLKRVPVIIFGTPTHTNIGDLAIAMAEVSFIDKISGHRGVPVSVTLINRNRDRISKLVKEGDILSLHGGGNMGDTYLEEENLRQFIIDKFNNIPLFIFPQTIYFSDTVDGRQFEENVSRLYAKHKKLTLITREATSKQKADAIFSNNTVYLTPDIVLSLSIKNRSKKRRGVVTCLRNDVEKVLKDDDYNKIIGLAKTVSKRLTRTDTVSGDKLFRFKKKSGIVRHKLREFSKSELVITDRLHGMVFAAITGTPCIVFTNFNHKVSGTYEWIKSLPYVKYCNSIDDIENIDLKLLLSQGGDYDSEVFKDYWSIIEGIILKAGE